MQRADAFSYQCNACGRCCRGKRIQVSPFEIAALARYLGISTGEFIQRCCDEEIPVYLRWREDRQCVFFDDTRGCTVHAARPLVCRLYPLGAISSRDGSEKFVAVKPHPQTKGVYGKDGTVADWLRAQGADQYMEEVARYTELFRTLVDRANLSPDENANSTRVDVSSDVFAHWLDVDRMVEAYCAAAGVEAPAELLERTALHRRVIWEQLGADNTGGAEETSGADTGHRAG